MTYYAAGRRDERPREWREVLALEPDNKFAKLYLRAGRTTTVATRVARPATARPAAVGRRRRSLRARRPETFVVEEIPAYPPVGEGDAHLPVDREARADHVRRDRAAGAALRRAARDIGYAGMKDRHATTRQWLSVPAAGARAARWR